MERLKFPPIHGRCPYYMKKSKRGLLPQWELPLLLCGLVASPENVVSGDMIVIAKLDKMA